MCFNNECARIEIIEVQEKIKVVIHFDREGEPLIIQYWDERTIPYKQYLFTEWI